MDGGKEGAVGDILVGGWNRKSLSLFYFDAKFEWEGPGVICCRGYSPLHPTGATEGKGKRMMIKSNSSNVFVLTRKLIMFHTFGGLPYMTSAMGGGRGVPKKQTKGTKSADL